ncbi:MAG: hypothetical protein ACR2HF_14830 [Methylococcaceae bacterium]
MLDSSAYSAKLRAGGFTEQQVEAQIRVLVDMMETVQTQLTEINEQQLSLKRDIRESELRMDARMADLHSSVVETHTHVAETKTEIFKWMMISVLIAQSLLIVGVMAMVKHVI